MSLKTIPLFSNGNRLLFLIMAISIMVGYSACSTSTSTSGDNGDTGDDTMREATFTNVLTIFNGSCSGSNCHIGRRESGVRLDSYDNVINSVGNQYMINVVQPGDAANSPIIDKISNLNPQFGDRMPLNRSPLPEEDIQLIRDWIDAGAIDN